MPDLLVVASPTTPLCTAEAIPTDGQRQHLQCPHCPARQLEGDGADDDCPQVKGYPDGPFPFWAARWVEVCPYCDFPDEADYHTACVKVGAIVALVEITGPSHHADDHPVTPGRGRPGERGFTPAFEQACHPDALPDCWHTPTGTVIPITPIPCERPGEWVACTGCDARGARGWLPHDHWTPASVWTAPAHIAAQLEGTRV